MLIKTLPVGFLETNCYVVTNEATLHSVVIDPGADANTIMDYLESNKLHCDAIMLTHGHFDHTGAVDSVAGETGAPVYMNRLDDAKFAPREYMLTYTLPEGGVYYGDGDVIEAAGMTFHVMATPGHTPGGVTLRCNDALFTGDTLFRGSCGRVDFPGASLEAEMDSLRRICALEGDYEVYPGHMDSTTLEQERAFNYYCRAAMHGEY